MSITVTFDLPPELEARLADDPEDLAAAVREGFALDVFLRGRLAQAQGWIGSRRIPCSSAVRCLRR